MKKPKVYVDLDGVLADLYGHASRAYKVASYRHIHPHQWDHFFRSSNAKELFSSLDSFSHTNDLLKFIIDHYGEYRVLSSPLNFDLQGSIEGKKMWLKKHVMHPAAEHIFDSEKYKYAVQKDRTPNILIDDYGINIKKWRDNGGIGIKFQADEDSVEWVKSELRKSFILT